MPLNKPVQFDDEANTEWIAIGGFASEGGDLLVPYEDIERMSTEEIGQYAKEAARRVRLAHVDNQALRVIDLAEQLSYNSGWLNQDLIDLLRDFEGQGEYVDEALDIIDYFLEHGSAPPAYLSESSKERKPTPGYVYLARAETGEHKIGRSKNPKERIKVFDTKMPVDVEIVHVIKDDDYILAEEELQKEFREKREKGEWFDLNKRDIDFICSLDEYKDGDFLEEA